jgi:hypothetical protein
MSAARTQPKLATDMAPKAVWEKILGKKVITQDELTALATWAHRHLDPGECREVAFDLLEHVYRRGRAAKAKGGAA